MARRHELSTSEFDPGSWAELKRVDPEVKWAYTAVMVWAADKAQLLPDGPTTGAVTAGVIAAAVTAALLKHIIRRK